MHDKLKPKERKVAKETNNLNKTKTNAALLQRCLLNNLDKVLAYFKQIVGHLNYENIKQCVTQLSKQINELQQKMDKITQEYHAFVYNSENDDINAVRGDNGLVKYYKETYDNLLRNIQDLQKQLDIQQDLLAQIQSFNLLKQLLDTKVRVDETQETINWQRSAAYASINRYDNDKEDEDQGASYEAMLRDYRAKLQNLCTAVLADKNIVAYLTILVAENNKRQAQSGTNSRSNIYE